MTFALQHGRSNAVRPNGTSNRGCASAARVPVLGAPWYCARCKTDHVGAVDICAPAPEYWPRTSRYAPPVPADNAGWQAALADGGDFLSDDLCIIGGRDFFIRCVALLPVDGMAQGFAFGVWIAISRKHFDAYATRLLSTAVNMPVGDPAEQPIIPGYFASNLRGFDECLLQPCFIRPRMGALRPVVTLLDESHALTRAQSEGICMSKMLAIHAAYQRDGA
jgi:hypothetical protein